MEVCLKGFFFKKRPKSKHTKDEHAKKISGIKPQLNTENAFKKTDVIIDFTIPKCTLEILKFAVKQKKKVVIGTTGFTKKEENLIKKFSKKIPILKAGNMSLGVNLMMYLTEIASKSLGKKFLSKVKINAVLKCCWSLKLASPKPNEIRTDGRAIWENGSNKLEIRLGGSISEKFKKIPINIPNSTIFFIKPNIVLTIIKM